MNPKHEWFKIGKKQIIALFIYYLLLLAISMYFLINHLLTNLDSTGFSIFIASLWTSIYTSVLGATIFYIRKLYKACINFDIQEPISNEDKLRQIGIFFYFFLRPIFSCIFSIIILLILKSGIGILSTSKDLTRDFYYISLVISFFTGYSSGDLIDKFEVVGKGIVDKVSTLKV